jgi:hypothetical protein
METIRAFEEPLQGKNLVYLAKPVYGGWVTFTAHMARKYKYPIHKVTKNSEKTKREYGYGCPYQNLAIQDVVGLPNVLITAVDKHFWSTLQFFPEGTGIVIHDPTECKSHKDGNPLVQDTDYGSHLLRRFKVYTIRSSVQEYLLKTFQIESTFLKHPFYAAVIPPHTKGVGFPNVSIARIDFDKNTDILLRANPLIVDPQKRIRLFGAENRLYVYHQLRDLGIEEYWLGKFPKAIIPTYEGQGILHGARYMIDLSTIKNDGGGTQYTFLEAIHQGCVLILNHAWIEAGTTFESGRNCIGVKDEHELSSFLNRGLTRAEHAKLVKESRRLLQEHVDVRW